MPNSLKESSIALCKLSSGSLNEVVDNTRSGTILLSLGLGMLSTFCISRNGSVGVTIEFLVAAKGMRLPSVIFCGNSSELEL